MRDTDPHSPDYKVSILPTPTHLFHFSALTFNAHSIHIDPEYARATDGHRALLVHGPLSLALMLRVLNDQAGPVARISYRNYAPLYANEILSVCIRRAVAGADAGGKAASGDAESLQKQQQTWDVWVEGPEGGLAVKGTAVIEAAESEAAKL